MSLLEALETRQPHRSAQAATPKVEAGRLEAYVQKALNEECAKVRDAVEGQRNDQLNRSAFLLGQFVGARVLAEDTAEQALLDSALACGLTQSESRTTVRSGLSSGKVAPRALPEDRLAPPVDDYVHTDVDAPDAVRGTHVSSQASPVAPGPTLDDPLQGLEHLGRVAVYGRDAILSLAREPIEYAWQDIAVVATIVLIAGPPSSGKTTILFLLLAARLSREPIQLLGRNVYLAPANQFIVLIEGEHSEPSAARKWVRSLNLLGVDDAGLERVIIVARKAVRLGSPEWQDVGRLVAAGLVSDIGIDTVARVAPADGSSEQEQVAIFEEVAKTIDLAPERARPTVWAVAHVRKNNQTGDVEDVSGSAQRAGQADSVLLVKAEKKAGRTFSSTVTFAKLREDPDDRWPEPATLSVVAEGDQLVLRQDSATAASQAKEPLEQRILNDLATGPKTKNGLREGLKRSGTDIEKALSKLVGAKSIRTTEVKVGNQYYPGYELDPEGKQARR